LRREGDIIIIESLFHLACGPDSHVFQYTSYLINIKDWGMYLKSQNRGVLVSDDVNTGNLDYSGVLIDIIELSYSDG